MSPRMRGAAAHLATRVIGSRFAKPAARVVLVGLGLVLLAIVGRSAGALGTLAPPSPVPATASVSDAAPPPPRLGDPPAAAGGRAQASPPGLAASGSSSLSVSLAAAPRQTASAATPHEPASPDDPVVLNTATAEDLRRLPGIGQKRAEAILALRGRLGRFHALEDLLKVKGLGRATLKRIRPLVRLE